MSEESFTHPHSIESVSDILDIINRPNEYLSEILDYENFDPHSAAPIGRHHQGTPRPYPHGIWFRGQANAAWDAVPSVFRSMKDDVRQYYDEREMFTDVRLRASDADFKGLNNLELMCLMQHHALPTRLLYWSESPLVATFFAASPQYYGMETYAELKALKALNNIKADKYKEKLFFSGENDCALYVLNAYRLNAATNLSEAKDSNLFHPQDIDVVLRSIMAEHTYINSVITKINNLGYVILDKTGFDISAKLRALENYIGDIGKVAGEESLINKLPTEYQGFYARLSMPVAVIPKRNHPRMDAQLSCFTMHGGKLLYADVFEEQKRFEIEKNEWHFIPKIINLSDLNRGILGKPFASVKLSTPRPFLKKFKISKYSVTRIMIELDRLGISEAMIFQDFENQSNFAKRRWATIGGERPILSLPQLGSMLPSAINQPSSRLDTNNDNYLNNIYGFTK